MIFCLCMRAENNWKKSELFDRENPLQASIDSIYSLDRVNEALAKVRAGGSNGKTLLKIAE